MRPFPGIAALGALAALLAVETTCQAAWNNVFQVSCFRNRRSTSRFLAPAACCPQPVVAQAAPAPCCPQPVCTTQYIQRSYYQPVTCYQQKTTCEPVTTYRTSYYYEPVTSYRYSCYYDPCTCSYQQVATPCTSYQLKQRCDPVTTYLQRTQMVPVTSYRLSYYYEPVTSCCNATPPAVPAVPVVPAPAVPAVPAVPGVGEQQTPGAQPRVGENPGITPRPGVNESFRFQETQPPPMGGALDSSFRQPRLQPPVAAPPAQPPPKVRLDRIVYLDQHNVEGEVLRADDQGPRAGARLLFVSADRDGPHESITADEEGRFRATLAKGNWLVYVRNREGTPVFQKRIEVTESGKIPVRLTSR